MAYNIRQNQSKYFFLASYQLSSGVEDKILTKNYFRGGLKIQKLTFFIKNEHLNIFLPKIPKIGIGIIHVDLVSKS